MDTIAPSSPPLEQKPRTPLRLLLINRNYSLLWGAMLTSQLGNFIFNTAIFLWVATTLARNAPWAAFAVGALAFMPQIVGLVFGTAAGVFVDRWNKRRTLLGMDGARALLVLLVLPVTGILPLPFPAGSDAAAIFQIVCLLLVIGLMSVCSPFVNGALFTILYEIVEEEDLPRAFGRGQVLNNFATIIGPITASAIFFTLGVQWAIILNAASFVVSFLLTSLIHPTIAPVPFEAEAEEAAPRKSFLQDLLEGLRFVGGNSVLVAMGLAQFLSILGLGALSILGIFFTTNNLHGSPQIYPFLNVAFGAGAMIGALTGSWIQQKLGLTKAFWLPSLATGVLLLLFARLTNFWLACVVLGLIGVAESVLFIAEGPLMLKVTPRELTGRANAVIGQIATLTSLISIVLAAFLVATPLHDKHSTLAGLNLGPIDILFTAAGIMVLASGLCSMITLRRFDPEVPESASDGQNGWALRRKQLTISGLGLLLAALAIVAISFAAPSYQASAAPQLAQSAPATGQAIAGLRCEATVGAQTHFNVHLSIYAHNQALTVPAGIGIVAPSQAGVVALASHGKTSCLYPLHVYENDNIVHVELHNAQTCTLGQFFAIWGQPLSRTQAMGYTASAGQQLEFRLFDAEGHQQNYAGDPATLPLTEHETIAILFQSPNVTPSPFTDWNGV